MKQVLKNFEKSSEIFWRFKKRSYLCSRFEIEKSTLRASKEVLKNFEKSSKKIWRIGKKDLPLQPLSNRKTIRGDDKKVLKKFRKKIWWFEKFDLTLHHFPTEKNGGGTEAKIERSEPTKRKKLFL